MTRSSFLKVTVAALMMVAPVAVSTASTTASVTLGGTVTSSLQITSMATGTASGLDLSGGQKIVKVSDLTISTNNEQGVTLTASSGDLTKTGGTSISYQVTSVDDGDPAPDATAFTINSGSAYTVGNSASGSFNRDLYIMYTPLALQDPGHYDATINLSVADN
jgi:hypothetical protein